jgi:hypothetical protein
MNQGTEAWAQAFKRACSQFGLGRYLYDLEKAWVPYNPQRKQIDLDATGRRNVVRTMYQKAGISVGAREASAAGTTSNNGNGKSQQTVSEGLDQAPPSAAQLDNLRELCRRLGKQIQKPKTFAEAKAMLLELQNEHDEMTARGRAS